MQAFECIKVFQTISHRIEQFDSKEIFHHLSQFFGKITDQVMTSALKNVFSGIFI